MEEQKPIGEVEETVDEVIADTETGLSIISTFLAFAAKLTEAYGAPTARIISIIMLVVILCKQFGWL